MTEMSLFDFRDWLAQRVREFSFGHIEEREGTVDMSKLLYCIMMLGFYKGGRTIPMHGSKPNEPQRDYFQFIGLECYEKVRQASDDKQAQV